MFMASSVAMHKTHHNSGDSVPPAFERVGQCGQYSVSVHVAEYRAQQEYDGNRYNRNAANVVGGDWGENRFGIYRKKYEHW